MKVNIKHFRIPETYQDKLPEKGRPPSDGLVEYKRNVSNKWGYSKHVTTHTQQRKKTKPTERGGATLAEVTIDNCPIQIRSQSVCSMSDAYNFQRGYHIATVRALTIANVVKMFEIMQNFGKDNVNGSVSLSPEQEKEYVEYLLNFPSLKPEKEVENATETEL